MRFHVLALDYEGTIATEGRLDPEVAVAIEELRKDGGIVLLVTGGSWTICALSSAACAVSMRSWRRKERSSPSRGLAALGCSARPPSPSLLEGLK